MSDFQKMVTEFHLRFGFPVRACHLSVAPQWESARSMSQALSLIRVAEKELKSCVKRDVRVDRAQLMVEELAEFVEAERDGDAIKTADAVADLCYVVVGTAVALGLPLERLVQEVHRSNMTKEMDGQFKPAKGASFSPPAIARILSEEV